MFWFNTNKYDFWPVYDAIKKYYPIGVTKEETYQQMYSTYPGRKLFGELLNDNQFHQENFNKRWVTFTEHIQAKTQKPVLETTHPQMPAFSAIVEMDAAGFGDVIRIKELLIFVSLLGPFYTIIGQNKSAIKTDNGHKAYSMKSWLHTTDYSFVAVYNLAISPVGEFENTFSLLCQLIEERFPGYRFVPFSIYTKTIAGLQVPYTDETPASVFQAIFACFSYINFQAPLIGDEYFKADDWIVEDYVDNSGGWSAFPPGYTEEQMKAAIHKK